MSHNVNLTNVRIADLGALQTAINELKREGKSIELLTGNNLKFRTFYGQDDKADAVIRLPAERYDIGLTKGQDGVYTPNYDAMMLRHNSTVACQWDASMAKTADAQDRLGIGLLMQRYSTVLTEQQAMREGHTYRRTTDKDGNVHVVIQTA